MTKVVNKLGLEDNFLRMIKKKIKQLDRNDGCTTLQMY